MSNIVMKLYAKSFLKYFDKENIKMIIEKTISILIELINKIDA